MSSVNDILLANRESGKGSLVGYYPAGYPTLKDSVVPRTDNAPVAAPPVETTDLPVTAASLQTGRYGCEGTKQTTSVKKLAAAIG